MFHSKNERTSSPLVATIAHIDHNRHRVRACAEALTHLSKSYIEYHVATQIHSRSIKATGSFEHVVLPVMPSTSTCGAPHAKVYGLPGPPGSENFVRREAYSEKIEATFHEANSYRRRVAIYGLPGMGKSQLMYHYVRASNEVPCSVCRRRQ